MNLKVVYPLLLAASVHPFAMAHTPICDCYDNGDDTITCEGGFSDGGTAAGVAMRILDGSGKILIEGAMSEQSDFTFSKPAGLFHVEFEGGDGHIVHIDGRDIEE
ncbi:MAG: hypothetical protein ACJ0SL_07130 [Candidatus Rariloculaceae bacterium]